jgi:hypothetical protein
MSAVTAALTQYPMPRVRSKADRLTLLQFRYALTLAHRPLLEAAKLPELLAREAGKAEWLRADIDEMGATPTEFDYPAACIAGSQLYLLIHLHPKVLLGYVAAFMHCPLWSHLEEEEPFPIIPLIEEIVGQNPWLGGHILENAQCSAAAISNVLNVRLTGKPFVAKQASEKAWTHREHLL